MASTAHALVAPPRMLRSPVDRVAAFVSDTFGGGLVTMVALLVAFAYPLQRLSEALIYDSPLGYLALVPLLALILGLQAPRRIGEANVRDVRVDFLIAVPCLALAGVVLVALPDRMGTFFWAYRFDLLALPFVVFAFMVIGWGTQVAARKRVAPLFLFLAWPVPYTTLLGGFTRWLTVSTASTVEVVARPLSWATRLPIAGDPVFRVGHGAGSFTIALAPLCSGAQGVFGFGVIGAALAVASKGRHAAKISWLVVGCALAFLANVLRTLAIVGVGATLGRTAAIDVLHPVAGLIGVIVATAGAVALMSRFGLRPPWHRPIADRPELLPPRARPRPFGLILLVPVALLLGSSTSSLRQFEPLIGSLGEGRLAALVDIAPAPPGWTVVSSETVTWSDHFFGSGSTWKRFLLHADHLDASGGALVTVDAITTTDPRRFAIYGVADCFDFHGFSVQRRASAAVLPGVDGDVIDFRDPNTDQRWSTLTFAWPVRGDGLRFERLSLAASIGPDDPARATTALQSIAKAIVLDRLASIGPDTGGA